MTATKTQAFTPGPWRAATTGSQMRDGYSQSFAICGASPTNLVAGVFGDVGGGEDVVRANANLIAAAPAMFAALQRASTVIADAITLRTWIDGDAEGTLKAVDDALALAIDGAS